VDRRGVLVAQAPLAGTKRVAGARLWSPRVVPSSPDAALAEIAFVLGRAGALAAGARQPAFLEMARAVQRRAEAAGVAGFLAPAALAGALEVPPPPPAPPPSAPGAGPAGTSPASAAPGTKPPAAPPGASTAAASAPPGPSAASPSAAPPAGPGGAAPARAIAQVPTAAFVGYTAQLLLLDGPRALSVALAEAAAGRREAIEQFAMAVALLAMNGDGAVGDRAAIGRTDESGAVLPAELTKIASRGLEVERFTYDGHEYRLERGPAGLTAVTRDGKPLTAAAIPFLQPDPNAKPAAPATKGAPAPKAGAPAKPPAGTGTPPAGTAAPAKTAPPTKAAPAGEPPKPAPAVAKPPPPPPKKP